MKIQKPTPLDAARICDEMKPFRRLEIESAFAGFSNRRLYLKFHKSDLILKFTVDPKASYIGITNHLPDNLQKALAGIDGFSFSDFRQINNDRIIAADLAKKDRLGKAVSAKLIFEIIPNTGDAYLVDDDLKIKSTLRKKRKGTYAYPPPLKKPVILGLSREQLESIIGQKGELSGRLYGLSDRDVLNLSLNDILDPDELFHDLREYVAQAIKPGPAWIISCEDNYIGFSLVKPRLLPSEIGVELESALLMYEHYYGYVLGKSDEELRGESLLKILKSEMMKLRKKITTIRGELEESRKADLYMTYGNLILANINIIEKGRDSIILDSLEGQPGDKMVIQLDPSKTAAANADDYFKKSRKSARSKITLEKRLAEAERRLAGLEDINSSYAGNPDLLERKMAELGLLPEKPGSVVKRVVEKRKPYRTYRASCGWEILVGKSNKDNDELTFHIASKEDYWFHAWQAAGSHTVLRLPDKSSIPDKKTLLEAASLAAYYSKAKHSSKVPVACTQVKYVRKPRKFPPGKVLVEREKELMVKPANPGRFLPLE